MTVHTIVVDLSFGDAGKGTVVDWLCARPAGAPVAAVVRFNGGAQAAHHVVTADGRHHAFAQFGAGSFTPGVATHLSRFMLVEPLALANEAAHLSRLGVHDVLDRLTVDRHALLTTPYHRAANQARERARGAGRHGSCGVGIGETMAYALAHPGDAPTVADCQAPARLARKLRRLRECLAAQVVLGATPTIEATVDAYRAFGDRVAIVDDRWLARVLRRGPVVFEGAQGVLLDEWRGFHPHTTWSTTTFDNAEALLAEAGLGGEGYRLGVLRTYSTRHGAGPLVTEDEALTEALPDAHNGEHLWQGGFRVGHFDAVAHRYAVEVCGRVDGIALTHVDRAAAHPEMRVCDAYQVGERRISRLVPGPFRDLAYQARLTEEVLSARPVYRTPDTAWPETVAASLGVPVVAVSSGPTAADKAWIAPARGVGAAGRVA